MMAVNSPPAAQMEPNFETYSLLWLDASVNSSHENHLAQQKLRASINHLVAFENALHCYEYIKSVSIHDRVMLIVSGHFGQFLVPQIVHFPQIVSIYVYCKNIKENEQWAQHFNKVTAVINQLDELIHRIHADQHQYLHSKVDEELPLSFLQATDGSNQRSVLDLNGDFLHSQILIDCLIKMKYDVSDKAELISICRQQYRNNPEELKIITDFDKNYLSDHALWWYTREAFLYKMLNKALRVQNVHLLYLFRFFIRHLQKHLMRNQCSSTIRVYRAQLVSNDEAQMLTGSVGTYISINSFFSTSFDQDKSLSFFSRRHDATNYRRVCFVIDANPQLENIKPFADISRHSYYPGEKEVLFMIGSIFRLEGAKADQNGTLFVRMTLCSHNDHGLKELFQYMKKEGKDGETNLIDFADVLSNMSKWDDAEKYYQRYLQQASHQRPDLDKCLAGLGSLANRKGDFEASLQWHHQSLEIKKRTLKPDDLSIAESYNSIGNAYEKKKDYANALQFFQLALDIFRRVDGKNQLYVATCMNNIGNTYCGMRKPTEALKFYQNALSIQKDTLPADHVNRGSSYKNIGNVLAELGQYDQALSYLNFSLEIYRKCRPSLHPSIAATLRSIGLVYKHKRDYRQALVHFEKAALIYRQAFPPTHPDVIHIEKDIQYVASKLI